MSVSLTSTPDRFSDDAWELLIAGQDQARPMGAQDLRELLRGE